MTAPAPFSSDDAFGFFRSFVRHVGFVKHALAHVTGELDRRSRIHDLSKLKDDEFAGFCRINAAARIHKFGSPEYAEGMKRERAIIDLHFSRNSHHAEYWLGPEPNPNGAEAMGFLDIIEMVCDWWGARKGYDDTRSWQASVELNLEQKGKYLSAEQIWLARQVASFLETV